jgi:alkanesulfonate monooxygenase
MAMSERKMKIGVFVAQHGHHEAAWRSADVPADAGIRLDHFLNIASIAERGKMHFYFLADCAGVKEEKLSAIARVGRNDAFEPLTLLAALSVLTKNIGLIATASTMYNAPYNIARMFASMDFLSKGRVGWNVVTAGNIFEAQNFGDAPLPEHRIRYGRAREFVDVVKGLWDSWEDDAFVRNKETGVFVDTEKLHVLQHKGEYFSVRGPINVARSPQGYPVLAQAGASSDGIAFAGDVGEVIFAADQTLEGAQDLYRRVKSRARSSGRDPSHVVVTLGVVPVVGRNDVDARRKLEELQQLVHLDAVIGVANRQFGFVIDLAQYDLDGPMPTEMPLSNQTQSRQRVLIELAKKRNMTVRDILYQVAIGRGHMLVVGGPETIADQLQEIFENQGSDGFMILPPTLPGGLEDFVELVLPELRRRGLFRDDYEGATFRDDLGLPRPKNQFQQRNRARTSGSAHPASRPKVPADLDH